MKNEVTILLAEDNDGHATLIQKNLKRSGIKNTIVHLKDGQETLDYLFQHSKAVKTQDESSILLLLDIKMPKVDGIEVLKKVKKDPDLKRMPVIMITTTDDPREVELCHDLGCSNYITKPVNYEKFVSAIRQLGLFLLVIEVPLID
jgi:CheY-like chemotaxis protein